MLRGWYEFLPCQIKQGQNINFYQKLNSFQIRTTP